MNETKRNYYQQDLHDWCDYAGVQLTFPDSFPLRTVLPLRVTLAAKCDPTLIMHFCKHHMQLIIEKCDLEYKHICRCLCTIYVHS